MRPPRTFGVRYCLLALAALPGCRSAAAPGPAGSPMVSAGTTSLPPAPSETPVLPARPEMVASVSLQLDHGFPLLPATVDGRHGWFLFDVGSPVILLMSQHVRAGRDSVLDTVSVDTAANWNVHPYVAHTLQVGTIHQHLAPVVAGTPAPLPGVSNAEFLGNDFFHTDTPLLGDFALPALEPFEAILDFVHRRVVLIRLDSAGHRLVDVPAYTPVQRIPLVDIRGQHWGIRVSLGDSLRTIMLDTGAPFNGVTPEWQRQLAAYLTPDGEDVRVRGHAGLKRFTLSRIVMAGHTFRAMPVDAWDTNLLGVEGFFQRLGIVGFNLRTRQMLLYRMTSGGGSA